jgi:RIO kinase 1
MAIHREKFKTLNDVFDISTEKVLFKFMKQGYFDQLESPISIGKEANVFSALKEDGTRVMVKIYRVSTCDFNLMHTFLREDPRFIGVKKKKREIVFNWAKREYTNLMKARALGVAVPTPHGHLQNVLVMDCIGGPAPKLKDLIPEDPEEFLREVRENYKKLRKAELVHGDLSQFNILNDDGRPVFIDMSQSCTDESHASERYLKRDSRNIASFFTKLGCKVTAEELEKEWQ